MRKDQSTMQRSNLLQVGRKKLCVQLKCEPCSVKFHLAPNSMFDFV